MRIGHVEQLHYMRWLRRSQSRMRLVCGVDSFACALFYVAPAPLAPEVLLSQFALKNLFRSSREQIEDSLDVARSQSLQQLALIPLRDRSNFSKQCFTLLGQREQRCAAVGGMRRPCDQFAAQQTGQRAADPGLVDMRSAAHFVYRDRLVCSQHDQNAQIRGLYAEAFLERQGADPKNQFGDAHDAHRDQADQRVDVRLMLAPVSRSGRIRISGSLLQGLAALKSPHAVRAGRHSSSLSTAQIVLSSIEESAADMR